MIANIDVRRKWYSARSTVGELYINGAFFCYTLEDTIRPYGIKVSGETAIPEGEYKCNITLSSRFKRKMPMVFTETNGYELINGGISFKGIRIHGGNTHANTEGCILVAHNKISSEAIQGTAEYDLTKELGKYNEIKVNIVNIY